MAVAWYNREEYEEVRAIMDDGAALPESYDAWRGSAQNVIAAETSRGSVVLKAMIVPGPFTDWCIATNQRPNVEARARFVNLAIEDYCSGYSSPAVSRTYEPV